MPYICVDLHITSFVIFSIHASSVMSGSHLPSSAIEKRRWYSEVLRRIAMASSVL